MKITDYIQTTPGQNIVRSFAGKLFAVLLTILVASSVFAATTDTWTNGVTANGGNWSANANWSFSSGSGPVGSGDTLLFGATGALTTVTNDLTTAGTNLYTIGFTNASQSYTIYGNGISLNSSGYITNYPTSSPNQTFNLPVLLAGGDEHLYPGSGTMTFNGVVTYTGRFYVDKQAGTIVLNSANTGLGTSSTAYSWSGRMSMFLNSGGTFTLGNKTALGNPNQWRH